MEKLRLGNSTAAIALSGFGRNDAVIKLKEETKINKFERINFYSELLLSSNGTHLNVHEMLTDITERKNESDSEKIERLKQFTEAYKTLLSDGLI